MTLTDLAIHSSCIALALLLFIIVNWIGRHAVSFGYSSTTLFEDPDESVALNFLIRTLPPAVFMVLLSAGAVASGNDELRLQSYWVAIYYYVLRAVYFPVFGLHHKLAQVRHTLCNRNECCMGSFQFPYFAEEITVARFGNGWKRTLAGNFGFCLRGWEQCGHQ
jgi:hypothetical protein